MIFILEACRAQFLSRRSSRFGEGIAVWACGTAVQEQQPPTTRKRLLLPTIYQRELMMSLQDLNAAA